jgi:hypothetical protein
MWQILDICEFKKNGAVVQEYLKFPSEIKNVTQRR